MIAQVKFVHHHAYALQLTQRSPLGMFLQSAWYSKLGLPCLAPRPYFPRHGFQVRRAAEGRRQCCACSGTAQQQGVKRVRLHRQRKRQRRSPFANALKQSSAALDTGQESETVGLHLCATCPCVTQP